MGKAESGGLKLDFDGHLRLEFSGARVTTDAGLLEHRGVWRGPIVNSRLACFVTISI